MSLADRIKSAQANVSNTVGCHTCMWWQSISPETRRLINEWLDQSKSRAQLFEILSRPGEDDPGEPLLPVSETGFRFHLKHHDERCR